MALQLQLRHDTAANWTAANPTLLMGEKGFESDTKKWKTGDGVTAWSSLAYDSGSGGAGTVTTVSVVSANGFSGSVATPTTTPAITITCSLAAGLVKSNGSGALVPAVAGTDYQAPLGFTPYNATNPSGYIAGINSSMVITALGYTPAAQTVATPSWSSTLSVGGSSTHTRITLGGATTLNFTAGTDGQKLVLELVQDATGSRLVTWGTGVAFGTDINSITLTTTASKRDIIGLVYSGSLAKWLVVAFARGY